MDKPIKVVYVMGVFRSGSTIFDIMLGNLPGTISTGELVNVQQYAWINNEFCSCGSNAMNCEFWEEVRKKWLDGLEITIEEFIVLQGKFERFKHWPLIFLKKMMFRKDFKAYGRALKQLYVAISKVSGDNVIIDSSKNPGRAVTLSMIDGIDLRAIHLVRDGRGVSWSCLKKFEVDMQKGLQFEIEPVSVNRTAFRWFVINISSTLVGAFIKAKTIRVLYEDLVTDVDATFGKLGDFIGVEVKGMLSMIHNGEDMDVSHTIAGNRVRMMRSIKLKPDLEWRSNMSDSDQSRFWRIGGLLSRFYGYQK